MFDVTYNFNKPKTIKSIKDVVLLEGEIIKETKYKGYYATNKGRIIGSRNNRITILHPSISKGYLHIIVCINNKRKSVSVHRLIAETFIPNPNNLEQINHKDENRSNNNVDNLEWCTPKYNTVYSQAKRIRCFNYKTKEFVGEYESTHEAARQLNLLQGEIVNVLSHRRNQKHTKGYSFEYV